MMTNEIKKIQEAMCKILIDNIFLKEYLGPQMCVLDQYIERRIKENEKALRLFFLMMFRQPAMCCTNGDFVRVVKEHYTEYIYNGIPFAREYLEQAPLRHYENRSSARMDYCLKSTLPIDKQSEFFRNIPIKEFHWNGKIFAKH